MNLSWYHFCFSFTLIIYLLPSLNTHSWCVPGAIYLTNCSRCWCVGSNIFICEHVECDQVPQKFWKRIKRKTGNFVKIKNLLYNSHIASGKTPIPRLLREIFETLRFWWQEEVKSLYEWFVTVVGKTMGANLLCIHRADYIVECNRCWCVGKGVFICGHIQCDNVPKRFWRSLKPTPTEEGLNALEEFIKKFKDKFHKNVAILPAIKDMFKSMLDWSIDTIKIFWKWLKETRHSGEYG